MRRKKPGNSGNLGRTTGNRDGRKAFATNPVAAQHVVECGEQALEPPFDQAVEFGPTDRQAAALAGQVEGQFGRRFAGQPFLGQLAFMSQAGHLPDDRGAAQCVHHQCLVHQVAGEVFVAKRVGDRSEVRCGVDKGDAGAASAEIEQRDHALGGQSRIRAQRGQCGDAIRHQPRRDTAVHEVGVGVEGALHAPQRIRTPVRRKCHRDIRGRGFPTGLGDQCIQSLDQ